MNQAVQFTVFVDGNNVMGSRPDGWWRDRAEATRRLVAAITPLALAHGGVWTIVFDGRLPPRMPAPPACLTLVHTGHAHRDGADDRIVELVHALPDRARSLVYTSDAELRARVRALDAHVAGARALLNEIAAVRGTLQQSATGRSHDLAGGAGNGKPAKAELPTSSAAHASRRKLLW